MGCSFLPKKMVFFWYKIKNLFPFFSHKKEAEFSTAYLQAILSNTVDSIITISQEGHIMSFNDTAEKMFGFSREEILGENVKILMPEPYHSEHDRYMQSYIATGKKKIIGIGREAVAKKKDGTIFPVDLAVSDVIFEGKHYFTGIIRDISDKKKSEEIHKENIRIEAEIKAKNEMLMTVAHELKTPLHAIQGFSECLIDEMDGSLNEAQKTSISKIYDASQHLLILIRQILDVSILTAKAVESPLEKCDIIAILKSCFEMVSPMVLQKKLKLKENSGSQCCEIEGNPRQLKEIFINLIANAIKFTDSGDITITVTGDSEEVVVAVTDTGIGMDEKDLPKLFVPFGRLDFEGDAKREGYGLGLLIAKKLVELQQGTIKVSSKKGEGTTFTVYLPIHSSKQKKD